MKQVIHIFGASGSGTTTLAKKISAEPGYTFMDTDDYFWLPTDPMFTQKRPVEERLALMRRDIERAENAVLSGSLTDWGDGLIPYFTLAVRIEMAQELRIGRLKQRERQRFGTRLDPGGDMHQAHLQFIEWAKRYDTAGLDQRSKVKHDDWQTLLTCPLIQLNGADELEVKFSAVKQALKI